MGADCVWRREKLMWHAYSGMDWWMDASAALWILFWVPIVWLIVSAIRQYRQPAERDDVLAIVRRRYASGEITREEFKHLRDDLDTRG